MELEGGRRRREGDEKTTLPGQGKQGDPLHRRTDALGRLEAKVSEEEADAASCCQLYARRDHLPRIKVEHDTPCRVFGYHRLPYFCPHVRTSKPGVSRLKEPQGLAAIALQQGELPWAKVGHIP